MGVSENKVHPMYGHFNRKYDDKPSKLGLHNFQTNPSETMVNLPPIFPFSAPRSTSAISGEFSGDREGESAGISVEGGGPKQLRSRLEFG